MKEYLTVRSKSPASLLLDVTIHIELVVESACMYETQLLMTSVWHTQTLSVSYLYSGFITCSHSSSYVSSTNLLT